MINLNSGQIAQSLNDLRDMIQQNNSNMQFIVTCALSFLGLGIAIFALGGPQIIKFLVNQKVNEELDKRLLGLLESNPPIFSGFGRGTPDKEGYLLIDENMKGIDQIDPETVISVKVSPAHNTIRNLEGNNFSPFIKFKNHKPYILIIGYVPQNGEIFYSLIWPRVKFIK